MNRILIATKNGDLIGHNYGTKQENELFKVAGFKNDNYFSCCAKWLVQNKKGKSYLYCVYGKTNGRANSENKYEFPPPIDNLLLFCNCVIVKMKNNKIVDLDLDEWLYIYDKLYGGFEDVGSEEDSEDEESVKRLKCGYEDDGFVIDDYQEDGSFYSEEEELMGSEEEDDDVLENEFRKTYQTRSKSNTIFTTLEN